MFNLARRFLRNIRLHSEPEAKSSLKQAGEILLLAARYRFSPLEYEAYGFFHKEKDWETMLTYLSNHEVTVKLRRPLYDKRFLVILNNKLLFNRFYASAKLPLPQFYGFLNLESGFSADASPLTNQDQFSDWLEVTDMNECFIKPAGGLQGFGVHIIKNVQRTDNGIFLEDHEGKLWEPEELYHQLVKDIEKTPFSGYIIEELVKQHPVLSAINASSVNTCRVLTFKNKDGSIDVPLAFMRFGRKGKLIDNMHQGGIAAGIEVDKGTLTRGTYSPKWGCGWTDVHPDSKIELAGTPVPFWQETKELAARAAAITPGIKTIGWDIAITESGPLLIEGNSSWSPIALQQTGAGFLTSTMANSLKGYGLIFR